MTVTDDRSGLPAARTFNPAVTVCAIILAAAALHFGQAVFAPIAFAVFIIAIVWPLQLALQSKMPKFLALLITVIATVGGIVLIVSLMAWGFSVVGRWFVANVAQFQDIYTRSTDWLETHGLYIAGPLAEKFNMSWLVRFLQGVAQSLSGLIGFGVLIFIYVIIGLLEVEECAVRLQRIEASRRSMGLVGTAKSIAAKFRRYMFVRSLASLLTGTVVWIFALGVGLELASAWGVIAFTLNFIPFLGPLVATALPTLFALAQFGSWEMALAVLAGLTLVQFLIGNYLEPLFAGAALSLSPFAVIFAVFLWSFLWGIPGVFIGVPVLIATAAICERLPSARWVSVLLTKGPATASP
ncbi:AI-2E family transporter [Aestuariivirga sp.]|uniref:AI-2E family transporter n=1 Tax=Aestuariivirga sp. TaxID=2650926 RepID=UPI003BAB8332